MSYLKIRDMAVEQIKAGMLPLYPKMTIEAHPGAFTEQTIRATAQRTPAILTSLVKTADGISRNSITFVSWVLYRASGEDKLYDGALKIISALTPVIRDADFGLDIKETAIETECLYSGALDAINITMWALRWELVLGRTVFASGRPEDLAQLENFRDTEIIGSADIKLDGGIKDANTIHTNS
jgi:hypothetical protein